MSAPTSRLATYMRPRLGHCNWNAFVEHANTCYKGRTDTCVPLWSRRSSVRVLWTAPVAHMHSASIWAAWRLQPCSHTCTSTMITPSTRHAPPGARSCHRSRSRGTTASTVANSAIPSLECPTTLQTLPACTYDAAPVARPARLSRMHSTPTATPHKCVDTGVRLSVVVGGEEGQTWWWQGDGKRMLGKHERRSLEAQGVWMMGLVCPRPRTCAPDVHMLTELW